MKLPRLNAYGPHYEEHCHNVAYLLRDIYENVGMQLHYHVQEVLRNAMECEESVPMEQLQEMMDMIGAEQNDIFIRLAKARADAAIRQYLEVTGAEAQEET